MINAGETLDTSTPAGTAPLPLPHYLLDEQSASLAELIAAERRYATLWWTHLNEMRLRKELPEWVKQQDVGSYQDHDLWCESRKALNQALFGSDDPGEERTYREVDMFEAAGQEAAGGAQ